MREKVLLPPEEPTADERALVRDATWADVADALEEDGTVNSVSKLSRTRAFFIDISSGKGINYTHKNMGPHEREFHWLVGEETRMDSNFHELHRQLDGLIVRSDVKRGKDYTNFPEITRDLRNGWTADDPCKRLARAQAILIRRALASAADVS